MQSIKHQNNHKYQSSLFYDIDLLYSVLSDTDCNSTSLLPIELDDSLQDIYNTTYVCTGKYFGEVQFVHRNYPTMSFDFDPKNIIVCYSGGKDSLSVIMHYKNLGYNVYAYHIKGLNRFYTDEWKIAEAASKYLGFTLIFDTVSYLGQHIWIEHPLKNMIMATMALNYGIEHKITTNIAVGTFQSATLDDVAFDVCAGDCYDMWLLYNKVIQKIIPGFAIQVPNFNFHTAFDLLHDHPDWLQYTISCMTPNRFRNLFRNRTQKKYNIKLLDNRCGCCWKCAVEYLLFCDKNLFDLNTDYYIHCVEVLLHTMEQEIGYKIYSIEFVWESYMFYPISESKLGRLLSNAIVRNGKIKITDKDS